GLVDPLPHDVEESGVIPFGGEHGVFVAVEPTRRTYRPRPLKHVVGVDSAPDGVLEAVEVPEGSFDGEASVLHFCVSGEPLNVGHEDANVLQCLLLNLRFYLQDHTSPLIWH